LQREIFYFLLFERTPYSIDTRYVTKINLKTRKTSHISREMGQNPPILLYQS